MLGREQVPETSPFDKPLLVWRLLRLLPDLLTQPEFAALARFFATGYRFAKTLPVGRTAG
ncbi:hypothetical protein DZS_00570 [Dickeya ananatis]